MRSEKGKKAKIAYDTKYLRERTKNLSIRLWLDRDEDIIKYMQSITDKNSYIKKLIREDIERGQR